MMPKVLILVVFVALLAGGCSKKSPCDLLTAAVCGGGETAECTNIKRHAVKADENSQPLCQQISALLPAPGKTLNECDDLAKMVCSERPLPECLNMLKEAAGADEKKVAFCKQAKGFVENSRKANAAPAPTPVPAPAPAPAPVPAPAQVAQPGETN